MKQDDRLWTCVWNMQRSSVSLVAIVSQAPIYPDKHICTSKYDGTNHSAYTVPENYGRMLLSKWTNKRSKPEKQWGWDYPGLRKGCSPHPLPSPHPEVRFFYENFQKRKWCKEAIAIHLCENIFEHSQTKNSVHLQWLYFIYYHWNNYVQFYAKQNTLASSY